MIVLATLAGLAVSIWAFGAIGFADIVAIARRIGIAGFLLYCLYSLIVFVILGGAWLAGAREQRVARLGRFTWARLIREAMADFLPFSQIGGLLFGARMLTRSGIGTTTVYASLIVDLTTEMASQLLFTLFGLAVITALLTGDDRFGDIVPTLVAAMVGLVMIVAMVFAAQRAMLPLARWIGRHLLPGAVAATEDVATELAAVYARRRRVALSFALNLAAWIASAGGAWIALCLMHIDIALWRVLTIESAIFTLRSAAFAIPAGIGVQEAGYALLAPLLGLPPGSALALALAKRARDFTIAIPTLVIWQMTETRKFLKTGLRPTIRSSRHENV